MKIISLALVCLFTLNATSTHAIAKSNTESARYENATFTPNELNDFTNTSSRIIHSIEFIVMLELFVSLIIFIAFIHAYRKSKLPYFSKAEKSPYVFS